MGRRGAGQPQQGGEVVHVGKHLIVGAGLDVLVGPRVAAAVGDRAVAGADRRELLLPGAQIAGASMHEDDGLTFALLAVCERNPVDGCRPDALERAAGRRSHDVRRFARHGSSFVEFRACALTLCAPDRAGNQEFSPCDEPCSDRVTT